MMVNRLEATKSCFVIKKISEEANVRLAIERIIRGIRDEVAEDSATTISRVRVIPKNIQLLE